MAGSLASPAAQSSGAFAAARDRWFCVAWSTATGAGSSWRRLAARTWPSRVSTGLDFFAGKDDETAGANTEAALRARVAQ
eukprot:11218492-Lingulodinium_polyedra.AAC.1